MPLWKNAYHGPADALHWLVPSLPVATKPSQICKDVRDPLRGPKSHVRGERSLAEETKTKAFSLTTLPAVAIELPSGQLVACNVIGDG